MTWTSHFDICWPCCPDQKNHSVKRLQHQDRVALQKRFNIPQQKTLTSTSDLDPVQEQKFLIKDLIIALEISLLSSIPRGEETLNFKVSNFLPKKNRKGHFCLEMNVQLLEEKSARHFLHNFPQSILLWANRRRRLGYLQVICGHIFFLGNIYLKIWKVHGLKYSYPFPHFLFNGKLRLVIFVAHWNLTSLISRSIGRDCSSFWKRIKKELRLINMYLLSCIQNTYKHSSLWTILRFDEEKDALFIYFCIPTWIDLGNKSFWLQ